MIDMHCHRAKELHSIAMHRAVADKIRKDPTLLDKAKNKLIEWDRENKISPKYVQRWREILSLPIDEILELIIRDTERMRDLRQVSPFCGILSWQERLDAMGYSPDRQQEIIEATFRMISQELERTKFELEHP